MESQRLTSIKKKRKKKAFDSLEYNLNYIYYLPQILIAAKPAGMPNVTSQKLYLHYLQPI